jgi:hypothetical protein
MGGPVAAQKQLRTEGSRPSMSVATYEPADATYCLALL